MVFAGRSFDEEYVFPAIRGVQARREYYVAMLRLRYIPKLFLFNEEELVPELRAQRILNRGRVPDIARYIVENRDNYTFSALTASIDTTVRFEPLGADGENRRVGLLHVPMSAQFVINDGQHRRAAIEAALKELPELAEETIAVVFFLDQGLERCQQMFADLNRHAVRPSKSLGLLYDHRDDGALVAREVTFRSNVFKGMVEMERSTLSARSRKLFTLSAIHSATAALLQGHDVPDDRRVEFATRYWDELGPLFPEWQYVRDGRITAGDVRRDFIHSHGITLQALGRMGNALLHGTDWRQRLKRLKKLDWSRSNVTLWEGRAMIGGRVSKAAQHVTLTTNAVKQAVGVPLTPDEQRIEDLFERGER